MNILEQLMGQTDEKMDQELDALLNQDPDVIVEAIHRKPLEGLEPGDRLQQIKLGEQYADRGKDRTVIFVQYWEPALTVPRDGNRVRHRDIVIATGVDKRDGELLMYAVDSTHYRRLEDQQTESGT